MVPAGMVKHVADANAARGFTEQNVLISASHTHSGPGGYANFKTFNTAAPSLQTATDPFSFFGLLNPPPADRQLYTFLTKQIAAAVRRADANREPAQAGWGSAEIRGLTQNRSIEAHLAGHGIMREYGQGGLELDPLGLDHTIDPAVNVLRVDKRRRVCRRVRQRRRSGRAPAFTGQRRRCSVRRVPIGGWSTFADHGTVTKSSFQFYNQDHHGSALRVFEDGVRREGKVPARQQVLNVYGNSNEGDQSAGLDRHGPAASDYVGRVEAAAMLRAWRGARRALSSAPGARLALDARLLLRPGHRGRQRGRLRDGRRARSSPGPRRSAGRCHDVTGQAARGHAQPGAGARPGPQAGRPAGLRQRAEGGAADGGAGGRPRHRDAARRGHHRERRPHQGSGAVGDGRREYPARDPVRPGQRLHPVLHHARGVRPPALRGRLDPVRAAGAAVHPRPAHRARRAARGRAPGAGAVPLRPHQRGQPGRPRLWPRRRERQHRRAARAPPAASPTRTWPGRAVRSAWTARSSAPS